MNRRPVMTPAAVGRDGSFPGLTRWRRRRCRCRCERWPEAGFSHSRFHGGGDREHLNMRLSTETARSDKWGRVVSSIQSLRFAPGGRCKSEAHFEGLHPFAGWLKRMRRVSAPNKANETTRFPIIGAGRFWASRAGSDPRLVAAGLPSQREGSAMAMGLRLTPITLRRLGHAEATISRSANRMVRVSKTKLGTVVPVCLAALRPGAQAERG
jgi:hypothetical protein